MAIQQKMTLVAARGIACLFVLLSVSCPAFAQQTSDIKVCKTDSGKTWYFSFGRTVFNIPDHPEFGKNDPSNSPIVSNISSEYALIPPEPDAPIGCVGNPQQLLEFGFGSWPRLEPDKYLGALPNLLDFLHLYRYPPDNNEPPEIDPIIGEFRDNATDCKNKKFITRYNDGSFLCSDKLGQLNYQLITNGPFQLGVAWEFIISGNLYHTPLGQNLVMSEWINTIESQYRITPDVIIDYEWSPPEAASSITDHYLVEVDKLFESKLLSYEVRNYPWPNK